VLAAVRARIAAHSPSRRAGISRHWPIISPLTCMDKDRA
jgi:hypothetical protein